MSSVRVYNSASYVWNSREQLGVGATGEVYVGYHKTKGTRVAVKMFTGRPNFKTVEREIEVVKQLPHHENIVCLFGVEEERVTRGQVIIMELCTNGSLFDVIDSPENAYGLCETELKQVVYDVAKGLQHLRQYNFVHRDIKPGNIMRCQNPDGSFVFKLADFGTARELEPEGHFISLWGTEEYLYPGMYERALINQDKREKFSAKVDLWSVGATFFHAATGRLPFQPYRKREDRDKMFAIISGKPSGVISGWQTEDHGQVIYDSRLPKDTRISDGLGELITEVLAGLMENDTSKMWEFDQFFKQIERIHRKKVVDVFCVSSSSCHKIFIDADEEDGLGRLKEGIQAQTGLLVDHQQLFYENLPYCKQQRIKASALPTTTSDRPMMVFGGNSKQSFDLKTQPLPIVPSAPIGIVLDKDLRFAKECSKVMYYFKYQVEEVDRVFQLMHQAARCYGYTISHDFSRVEQKLSSFDQLNKAGCRVLSGQMTSLTSLCDTISTLNQVSSGSFQSEIQVIEQSIADKDAQINTITTKPGLLRNKFVKIRQDFQGLDDLWDSKRGADAFYRSIESIQYMVLMVDKDLKTFQRDKRYVAKGLNAHDQKVHGFTKERLQRQLGDAQQKVVSLVSARSLVHSNLADWLLRMIPLRADVAELERCIEVHSHDCRGALDNADKWEADHKRRLESINNKIASCGFGKSGVPPKPSQPTDSFVIPRHLCTSLVQSRNDLSNALSQQRALLERLTVVQKSNTDQAATVRAPHTGTRRYVTPTT